MRDQDREDQDRENEDRKHEHRADQVGGDEVREYEVREEEVRVGPVADVAQVLSEREATLALSLAPQLGPVRIRLLLEHYGSARAALQAPQDERREVAGRLVHVDRQVRAEACRVLERCAALGIRVVAWAEPEYPPTLRAIHDPPPVLYLRGTMPECARAPWSGMRSVAVVGTRDASSRGRRFAAELGGELAAAGVVVVSGLALGIDGAAHEGALAAANAAVATARARRTAAPDTAAPHMAAPNTAAPNNPSPDSAAAAPPVAVLAGGLDVVRPAVHGALAQRILAVGGALLSEDPPGAPAPAHRFVARNRIVSGLSRAVVVVEAGARSGALHTATFAAEQGRDVFAVPDHPTNGRTLGTLRLLRDGGHILTGATDILELYAWGGPAPASELPDHDLRLLVALTGAAPCPLERLPGDPVQVLVALARLEIEGFVERDGVGRYHPTARGRRATDRTLSEESRR